MAGNSLSFHTLTPESLYWLGWLASDGSVYDTGSNGWRIALKLQNSDKACVERFALFIGSKPPTQHKTDKGWQTALLNSIMGRKLIELGITERKSHTLVINNPEVVRSPYFWRGAFEGDGCFQLTEYGYPKIRLYSASKAFLEQFQQFFPDCTIAPKGSKNYWAATSCSGNAKRLLNRLYDGTQPNLVLERKQIIIKSWIT